MDNITLFQFFHWYYPSDGSLWKRLKEQAPRLAELGINAVWLPPACKGSDGIYAVGYGIYDLFDLGEFDQKGTVRTKYGTKDEYLEAIKAAHDHGILIIADAVLNHKAGGDEKEKVPVRKVNPDNRNEFISEQMEIEAYTKFTFPGRQKKYSEFIWDWHCFSGVDWAADLNEKAVYKIQNEYGEGWAHIMGDELGNYDYLMFDDIDYRNPHVKEEVKYWGRWYLETTGADGFRLDAVKHMNPQFIKEWVDHLHGSYQKKQLFFVGEYWHSDNQVLLQYIKETESRVQLFDAPLHEKFFNASHQKKDFDLRTIFDDTLLKIHPTLAVTVVDNHDTQPLQSMESMIEYWFLPLAYSICLLREQGIPCVFYAALFTVKYSGQDSKGEQRDINLVSVQGIENLLLSRKKYAYGFQRDYFNHHNVAGWTREGDDEHAHSGLAVVLSNGDDGTKKMEMGKRQAGKTFVDILKKRSEKVKINKDGWGKFFCKGESVSVWVNEEALQ